MRGRDDRHFVILLADDDPGDQELVRRASRTAGIDAELRVVADGEEALEYLHQRGRYAPPGDAPRPDLMLLDLNMPRLDGRQVLQRVRSDPQTQRIPVVVFTTSDRVEDVRDCYQLGCNSFITKPAELSDFVQLLERLKTYWFELVTLPI
ncbi:MAG: response regulator [Phycisphaerae bacterium]|jgi:CheY-like chemotaxis protein